MGKNLQNAIKKDKIMGADEVIEEAEKEYERDSERAREVDNATQELKIKLYMKKHGLKDEDIWW